MKRLVLALVVLLAAGLLSSCSSSDDEPAIAAPAATVNGVEIPSDEVLTVAQGGQPYTGLAVPTSQTAAALNELINVELARQEVADRDLVVSQATKDEALEIAYAVLDPSGAGDVAAGKLAYDELPESLRTHLTDQFGLILTLGRALPDDDTGAADVTEEMVQQAYDEARDSQYVRRCSSLLLIDPTMGDDAAQEEKADEVLQRIEDGDSFEDIIADESPDPAAPNGGPLGCASQGEMQQQMQQSGIPPEIVEAVFGGEVGSGFGPIATQTGLIVGYVEEEQVTPFEEVAAEIESQLDMQNDNLRIQAAFALIDAETKAADVTVDPRFGTWSLVADRATGQVVDDPADAVGRSVVPPAGAADPPVDPDATEAPLIPEGLVDPSGGAPIAP